MTKIVILPSHSLLEILTLAAEHLITQGERSIDSTEGNRCVYRGLNGLMCGAGPAIPDEKYNVGMEGSNFRKLNVEWQLGFDQEQTFLIQRIQFIHDSYTVDHWPSVLQDLANKMELRDFKCPEPS